MTRNPESAEVRYLGIEGGGTRTVALLADGNGQTLRRLETGPANMKLLTAAQLTRRFRSIAAALPLPGRAGDWAVRGVGGGGLPEDPVGRREGLAANPVLRYQRFGDWRSPPRRAKRARSKSRRC